MYKLIIVDDEPYFRKSFLNIIDWNSLGFEVCACFSDGKYAIEYINSNQVDVVITDIKMTFVSGIELAKYIYENHREIQVVINSGYSDIQYSSNAIKYGVKNYLLKPTNVDLLIFTMKKLKNELDSTKNTVYEKMSKRVLLLDIYNGMYSTEEKIQKKLDEIGFNINASEKCAIFEINILNLDDLCQYHERETVYEITENFFVNSLKNIAELYAINFEYKTVKFVILGDFDNDSINNALNNIKINAGELFNAHVEVKNLTFFSSLLQMGKSSVKDFNNQNAETKFRHFKELFVNYSRLSDTDNLNSLIASIKNHVAEYKKSDTIKFVCDFFAYIGKNLKKDVSDIINSLEAASENDYYDMFNKAIDSFTANIQTYNLKNETIKKAKEYIDANFSKNITLESVANHVFLNKIYFCRLFKQETGETFNEYLTKIRMEKATVYLKNPSVKISDISHLIGYNSSRYFSKIFKNYLGITPAEYRAATNNENI